MFTLACTVHSCIVQTYRPWAEDDNQQQSVSIMQHVQLY